MLLLWSLLLITAAVLGILIGGRRAPRGIRVEKLSALFITLVGTCSGVLLAIHATNLQTQRDDIKLILGLARQSILETDAQMEELLALSRDMNPEMVVDSLDKTPIPSLVTLDLFFANTAFARQGSPFAESLLRRRTTLERSREVANSPAASATERAAALQRYRIGLIETQALLQIWESYLGDKIDRTQFVRELNLLHEDGEGGTTR